MAATYDFTIDQYTDWSRTVTLTDTNGFMNLTGVTFNGQLRASADGDMLASFTVAITDALTGKFTMSLSAAVTGALGDVAPSGVYDFIMTDSQGKVRRLFAGSWVMSYGVTR